MTREQNKLISQIRALDIEDDILLCLQKQDMFVCLFDLILYVPSTIFQLNRDGSSWVEPVLS